MATKYVCAMEEKRGGTAFTLSRRIGSTTYLVNVCCSDTAAETLEDKKEDESQ